MIYYKNKKDQIDDFSIVALIILVMQYVKQDKVFLCLSHPADTYEIVIL